MMVCGDLCLQPNSVMCEKLCFKSDSCDVYKQWKKMNSSCIKTNNVNGNIKDASVVIVYGDVKGNIKECQNVIIINGDIKGNILKCENVCGLLADQPASLGGRAIDELLHNGPHPTMRQIKDY